MIVQATAEGRQVSLSQARVHFRRHRPLLACAFLCAAGADAQRPAVASLPPTVSLTGVVRDTMGVPVPGAIVRVSRTTLRAATDTFGRFVIAKARAGDVRLEVARDGFPSLSMDVTLSRRGVDSVDVFLYGAVLGSGAAGRAAAPTESLPPPPIPTATVGPASRMRSPRTLRGSITDTLGRPLVGAIVSVMTQSREYVTGAEGRYSMGNLIPGATMVHVRRIGFAPRSFLATISNLDAVVADVPLVALGQELARVNVSATGLAANSRLSGFFARKKTGFGQFMTRDQFEDRNPRDFTDLMNRMSGVVSASDPRGKRRIYGRGRCEMALFLDGINIIIPDGTSVDDFIDVYQVEALEVHNRATGLPAEFSGRTNACGVVAVWTRSRSGR